MNFQDLWSTYITAWPFQAAHGAVAILVVWQLVGAFRETRYLRQWTAGDTTRPLGGLLDRLRNPRGGQGLADAVQTAVEDPIESLNTSVSFFLLIGIAGTFYGMSRLAEAQPNADQLKVILTEGLRSALPIGFFGVVLTIVGQFVASRVAAGFRQAASDAIARAQGVEGDEAFDRLATKLNEVIDLLRVSLSPLTGIEAALTHSLRPIVTTLAETLEATQKGLGAHLENVSNVIGDFREIVTQLQQPIATISKSAQTIEQTFEGLEGLLNRMDAKVDLRIEVLTGIDKLMADAIRRMDASTEHLQTFPATLGVAMDATFAQMSTDWKHTLDNYTRDLVFAMIESNRRMADAGERAGASITKAAADLENFSHNAGVRLTEGIERGAEVLKAPLVELRRSFENDFPETIRVAADAINVGLGRMGEMRDGLTELARLTDAVRAALEGWSRSHETIETSYRALAHVATELRATSQELSQTASTVAELERSYITIRWPKTNVRSRG